MVYCCAQQNLSFDYIIHCNAQLFINIMQWSKKFCPTLILLLLKSSWVILLGYHANETFCKDKKLHTISSINYQIPRRESFCLLDYPYLKHQIFPYIHFENSKNQENWKAIEYLKFLPIEKIMGVMVYKWLLFFL